MTPTDKLVQTTLLALDMAIASADALRNAEGFSLEAKSRLAFLAARAVARDSEERAS